MPGKKAAVKIVSTLQKAGYIAYFAGGWVRDYLLNLPSDDIDIATSASPEEIQALFPKTIPVGIAFGIVVVVMESHSFEVATFRKEKEYVDGRRPSRIEPCSPEEDALRRDFTINGMFFDPIENTLFDYVGGQEDIKKGVIRAIGDPHLRFLEDRLRMIRAVRYSTRFQFPIEIDTVQAILSHAGSLFPSVAIERVWQELHKMSSSEHFAQGLLLLHKLELLPVVFPSLKNVSPQELSQRLAPLQKLSPSSALLAKILCLFPPLSLDEMLELCEYLKLSREEKDLMRFLASSEKLLLMPLDWQRRIEPIEWAHFYAHRFSALALELYFARLEVEKEILLFHKENEEKLSLHIGRIQSKNPLVRANDLLKEGVVPGIHLGDLLKEAERIAVNQDLSDKAAVLTQLKNSPLWKPNS